MKQSRKIAAGLLGIAMLAGCSAPAKVIGSEPDTEKIQIVGQIETPAPAAEADDTAKSSASEAVLLTPEPVPVTEAPAEVPTDAPTQEPAEEPTPVPTEAPTPEPTATPEPNRSKAEQFCDFAKTMLDRTYRRGGKQPETGFDPGGFVYYCLNGVGVSVRHKTSKGYSENDSWLRVDSMEDLEPGDLCFFMTPGNESVNCVSIYLGSGQMIYPSSGEGKVITAKISSNYWKDAFVFARRVF